MMYRVTYMIDVEAENELDAAREAYACMTDSDSLPPVLTVQELRGFEDGVPDLGDCTDYDLAEYADQLVRNPLLG